MIATKSAGFVANNAVYSFGISERETEHLIKKYSAVQINFDIYCSVVLLFGFFDFCCSFEFGLIAVDLFQYK